MSDNHNFNIYLFCEGNNEVLTGIYKQWAPQLFLVAYNYLKSREEAKDIVADCFEKLLKMSGNERTELFIVNKVEIKAALIVIVRSKSLDALKKKKNRLRIVDSIKKLIPVTTVNKSSQVFTDEDFSMISNFLSVKERTILTLNIEGYTHQEISEQLSVSEKTVSNVLSLSRKKTQKLWEVFMD